MTKKRKLVIATTNSGKVKEIEELLSDLSVELLSLKDYNNSPEVVEDKDTFAGNALKKAREICDFSGEITLADDSGLEVDYLDKAPGVYSARFAGPGADDDANNRLLLQKLKGLSKEKRTAAFRCAMAIVTPAGEEKIIEESCNGYITEAERGKDGFGYDPLFFYKPLEQTFGEMLPEDKNKISHRGKALKKIKPEIKRLLT